MILKAAQKFNIDLSQSYMAGDHNRDVQCAVNAGCKPVFLTNGEGKKEDIRDNDVLFFSSLNEFSDYIVKQRLLF